jgi:hypothetical protein
MTDTFSRRHGLRPVPTKLVRDDAPRKMRSALVALLSNREVDLLLARDLLYRILREVMPNWMELVPSWRFFDGALQQATWYEVFDFLEALCCELKDLELEENINELFDEYGIGWKVHFGQIETRGDELFEQSVNTARGGLRSAGRDTAANELNEAMADLSRRPEADARGAIIRRLGSVSQGPKTRPEREPWSTDQADRASKAVGRCCRAALGLCERSSAARHRRSQSEALGGCTSGSDLRRVYFVSIRG